MYFAHGEEIVVDGYEIFENFRPPEGDGLFIVNFEKLKLNSGFKNDLK